MTPALGEHAWATILYWLLMAPIAAAILHVVAGYLAEDYPSGFLRALGLVLLTAISVFLAFDVSSYLFALMMRDPAVGITFPPGFTYWDWMREPLILKWRVLGLVPFIRIVPVIIALIVGCLVQVFVWKVEFKIGLAVFLAQAILTVAAMLALSFVFRLGIVYYEHFIPPKGVQPAQAKAPRGADRNAPPADMEEMAERANEHKGRAETLWHNLDRKWESVNGHLAPMYAFLEPVTEHLPHPIHDFMNAGGWLLAFAGILGLVFFGPRFHRNRKEILKPKKKRTPSAPTISLASIGDSVSGLGERQATINGAAGRLRLVIVSPNAAATGASATPAPTDQFLNSIRADLSQFTAADYPRFEVWNDPAARNHFRKACETRVQFPAADGELSNWVLALGPMTWHGKPTQVALGFLTTKPATQRIVEVLAGQWASAIGKRDVPKDERD